MTAWRLAMLVSLTVALCGCAFFNTFFNARKAYNNGVAVLKKSRAHTQGQGVSQNLSLDRFSLEGVAPSEEAKQFFGLAIEKGNKVVVLHPTSSWVEDAILLMGKAHYLRGTGNDYYDAKNRFEVFMTRYAASPMLPEAKLWYGKTLIKLRLNEEASDALRQVPFLTTDPNLIAESLLYLGDLSSEGSSPDVALDYYRRAAEQKCRAEIRRVAQYKSAFVLYTFGQYEEAVTYAQKLSRQDVETSERFDVQWLSSLCFNALGQHSKTIAILDEVVGDLRYKNHFAQAEFGIADALRRQGRFREAEKQFNHVIDEYKNPTYSGDSFFMLGLMHDSTTGYDTSQWHPNRELALKYYSIVQNKYGSSTYGPIAVRRLDHLRRLARTHAAIHADNMLWRYARGLQDGSFKAHVVADSTTAADSAAPSFSATELIREDRYLSAWLEEDSMDAHRKQDVPKQDEQEVRDDTRGDELDLQPRQKVEAPKLDVRPSIAELENVRIDQSEIKQILTNLKNELERLFVATPADSLAHMEHEYYSRLAAHYMNLADYYDQTAAIPDSAQYYYTKAAAEYPGSAYEEQAYYSAARVQMKMKSPFYLRSFEDAYHKFPTGHMASVARRILGIEEPESDTLGRTLERAEDLIFRWGDYDRSVRLLEDVASLDTGALRIQALYTMGWICERKLNEPARAFRFYNTVAFLSPKSELVSRVAPKIEAYARQHGITQDSLMWWTDLRYFKPVVTEARASSQSTTTLLDSAGSAADSVVAMPLDSAQVKSILEALETEIDSALLKRLEMDSTHVEEDAEKEENAEIPE